jgi:6-phosphogluconolactonase
MLVAKALVSAATCLICCAWISAAAADQPVSKTGKLRLYIGTYTGPKSKGIYRLELDLASGQLSTPALAGEVVNPSFLAIHPSRRFLYAVNEVANFKGEQNNGGVSALAIDARTGDLTLLNQQSSRGAATCHLVVDKAGKTVLVASYTGGSVASLPIGDDGRLGPVTSFIQHEGKDIQGQPLKPHGHSINLDAGNRFAVAADLGLDKLFVYKFDSAKGTLTPNDPPYTAVSNGSGPRHFAFHPNARNGYVINERAMTVTVFDYKPQAGTLNEIQTVSTIPGETQKGYSTAEVVVHPSGKFLYGSNRGHNSIAVFKIDESTGKLTPGGHASSGIKTPRNFAIDPAGQYLIVANQDGHNLIVFRINEQTGELTPTGHTAEVTSPVCIRMMPTES